MFNLIEVTLSQLSFSQYNKLLICSAAGLPRGL